MSEDTPVRYYLAFAASILSVAGWLSAAAFGVYAAFLLVVGGSLDRPAAGLLVSLVVGIVFAKVENSLYPIDWP